MTWADDSMSVVVQDCINPNRFAIRAEKFTEEEKIAYRAKRNEQTPEQNLRDLMRETWWSKWQVSNLYPWMEANCPGYTAYGGLDNSARITFADRQHAMHFKLVWA